MFFQPKRVVIFLSFFSPRKYMLLVSITSEELLTSTHKICFHVEIIVIMILLLSGTKIMWTNEKYIGLVIHTVCDRTFAIFCITALIWGTFFPPKIVIFLIIHQNICCGYSLEAPVWDDDNDIFVFSPNQHYLYWEMNGSVQWSPNQAVQSAEFHL